MAKRNYIDSGVSDSDLISLAGDLQASRLAVPEKTTWEYVREDIQEWQKGVKDRAAKFMEDLPEEFDLNKVEPEGREAISDWYKTMRKDFMKAANNASLFDPGSFAYGEGTSKMNKIEDNLGAVNGIFDNIKAVRTQAIKDKDNYASRVTADQKAMMDAIVSGEMFEGMEIKDGGIQFKVDGATYPDGQDYFTEEDIKNLPTKAFLSEQSINALNAQAEEFMSNGVAFVDASFRAKFQTALNNGKKTGENMDVMLDMGGINEDGVLNPEPYVAKYIRNTFGYEVGTPEYSAELKKIKGNMTEFYNKNEQDFIDNFLMPNARNIFNNTEMGEKASLELLKKKKTIENIDANINNTQSITRERENKIKNKELLTSNIEKQTTIANDVLGKGGSAFNLGDYSVTAGETGGYIVTYKDGKSTKTRTFTSEDDLRGFVGLERTEEDKARQIEIKEQKKVDYATSTTILNEITGIEGEFNFDPNKNKGVGETFKTAFKSGPSEAISFIRTNFGDSSIQAEQIDGDTIKLTVGNISKTFMTNPAFSADKKAKAMIQWISDNLNK